MIREPDPARLLLAALRRSAAAAGCAPKLVHAAETPWASATFVGGQHRVHVTGTELDVWLAALPEAGLPLWRHLVADLVVEARPGGASLLVLVLEE